MPNANSTDWDELVRSLPLSVQSERFLEAVRLMEGDRLLGYSIRITGER